MEASLSRGASESAPEHRGRYGHNDKRRDVRKRWVKISENRHRDTICEIGHQADESDNDADQQQREKTGNANEEEQYPTS